MMKVIAISVLAFASTVMADNVWYNCTPINGQSVQVLSNATVVLTGKNGVASFHAMEMYNNTPAGQDYVSADRQLIFSKRSSSAAIYDGGMRKISKCSENSPSRPYPDPYDPGQFQGCPDCWNDGGFP